MRKAVSAIGSKTLGVLCGDFTPCFSFTSLMSVCLATVCETNTRISPFLLDAVSFIATCLDVQSASCTYSLRRYPGKRTQLCLRAARCPDARPSFPLLSVNQLQVLLLLRSAPTPTEMWAERGFCLCVFWFTVRWPVQTFSSFLHEHLFV